MINRKTIIWTLLAVAFIGGLVYFSFLRKPKVQYTTEAVKRGTLKQTVSVTGTLKAHDTLGLNFEVPGRIKSVGIDIGQKVAKGDLLATLDQANLELSVEQAKANLDKARADAGVNFDSIHSAKVEKENSENYLEDTKSLNKKNIAAAEQAVSDTKDYLDDAQSYYNKVKDENGSDSSTTKSAKLTLDTAEANYEQAKDALDVADQTADLAETSAQNKLNTADAALDAAESDNIKAGKDANVAAYEAAYETAVNNLDKAALRAPVTGTITQLNFKAGEVIGSPSVTSTTGIFAQMISEDFIFEALVSETDIAKVVIGQKATLVFDALPDDTFDSEVVSIEPSATVVQDVVDYVVKLSVSKSDTRFRDGLSADVNIATAEKNNVISVPERIVKDQNGKKVVSVLAGGKPVDKVVTLGLSGDEGMVEIVSGLQEGDEVITATQ
ncbi:MAG: efflux RND transporter periplasmic adaptor subunit [Candidatus Moranbacteria bacterium]|nr:efflux RND transporter periplasmic adaptor subunit [Candidatus Moranbacteria bacterium]